MLKLGTKEGLFQANDIVLEEKEGVMVHNRNIIPTHTYQV